MTHFADRIIERSKSINSRLVVGLDPHWHMIPASHKKADREPGVIAGDYMRSVVEATHQQAVAFKPQIAFFEQFGVTGMQALVDLLKFMHELGVPVIMDGKRNDIGSTAAAYARAFFGDDQLMPAFPCDALTINGYLGLDGIQPFLLKPTHGIFVLVKTSNPSSGDFQDLKLASGETLAERVASQLEVWNRDHIGESGYGLCGSVVGATYPEHMRHLRQIMPSSLILVPGYGAQGGDAEAVRSAFKADGTGALINSSRGICFPKAFDSQGFKAVAAAAEAARVDIQNIVEG